VAMNRRRKPPTSVRGVAGSQTYAAKAEAQVASSTQSRSITKVMAATGENLILKMNTRRKRRNTSTRRSNTKRTPTLMRRNGGVMASSQAPMVKRVATSNKRVPATRNTQAMAKSGMNLVKATVLKKVADLRGRVGIEKHALRTNHKGSKADSETSDTGSKVVLHMVQAMNSNRQGMTRRELAEVWSEGRTWAGATSMDGGMNLVRRKGLAVETRIEEKESSVVIGVMVKPTSIKNDADTERATDVQR